MITLLLGVLAALLLAFGFEMFLVLGIPSLIAKEVFFGNLPDVVVVQKLVGGVNHTTLLAIPFFIFAAEIMARGSIARHLTELVKSMIGHRLGGMGHTTVASCMAFGSISGSAPATVAALGRIVYPELGRLGYRDRFSLGLIVASAETALLIPPSITLIIYGWVTGTSVGALFAGGLAVGIVLGVAFMLYVHWESARSGIVRAPRPSWAERIAAFRAAGWALGLPVIILGGIYGGVVTATEAAAASVLYAIFVEFVVYREMGLRRLAAVAEESAITTGVVFILLAVGSLLSYLITLARVPDEILALLRSADVGPILFLLIVNVIFFIAGMFVDPNSQLLVLVPTLFPVAVALGIDPVHFGLIVCLNICIGMITPPFGLDLFVASSTLGKPILAVVAGVWPFVAINLAVLMLITYVPDISLVLPRLLMG